MVTVQREAGSEAGNNNGAVSFHRIVKIQPTIITESDEIEGISVGCQSDTVDLISRGLEVRQIVVNKDNRH